MPESPSPANLINMKLSMRTRYGLRALIDLAREKNGPVSIREIAGREHISLRYLENIFNDLVREGLLSSTRGKNGGFVLARQLDTITLLEVVEILEGRVRIVDCLESDSSCPVSGCLARGVWMNLNNKITEALAGVTLKEVFESETALLDEPTGKA